MSVKHQIWKIQIYTEIELYKRTRSRTKGQNSTNTDTEPRTHGINITCDNFRTSLGLA